MKGKELPLYRPAIDEKEYIVIRKKGSNWFDSLPLIKNFLSPAIDLSLQLRARLEEFYYNNKAIGWVREQDKPMLIIRLGVISCFMMGPRVWNYKKGFFVRETYTILGGIAGTLIVYPTETCHVYYDGKSKILAAYYSIADPSKEEKKEEDAAAESKVDQKGNDKKDKKDK